MINSSICITEYNNQIISWLDINSKIEQLAISNAEKDINGNIYVGKIKHIVKNINAAFVEFLPETLGFLSLSDTPVNLRLYEGDDIVVQVVKEAAKGKEAVLTMNLSLQGEYCVIESGSTTISISKKISGEKRALLRDSLVGLSQYGIIVRTKADYIDNYDPLKQEIKTLSQKLSDIIDTSKTRISKSLIYKNEPSYKSFVKSLNSNSYERIITDIESVCDDLQDYNCQLYRDDYSLAKLYCLETKINEILSKNIWLKSGANIVIDVTEAMTVIDVNSAKNLSNKDREKNILDLNLEATTEICRQIRLRNLSGIIIIDYINMHNKENEEVLIAHLKKLLSNDSIRTDYIDITKLGLVEIVRKKIKPPIYELIQS